MTIGMTGMVPIWSLVKLKINKSGRPQNVRLLNEQNYKKKRQKKWPSIFIKQNRELGEMNILIWIICVILNWMSVQSESDLKSKASFHTKIA